MIRIGIVGAENSHTVAISRLLNIEKKVPGCRVICVWGEASRYARDAVERGGVPAIVKTPEDHDRQGRRSRRGPPPSQISPARGPVPA